MNARNILIVIALLLAGLFGWTWMKNSGLKKEVSTLAADKSKLTKTNGDLNKIKEDLETERMNLEADFNRLAEEKADLEKTLKEEKSRTARRNVTIKKLKAAQELSTNDNASLEQQISSLLASNRELQSNINSLAAENAELKDQLGIVQESLSAEKGKSADLEKLNQSMQSEIANLTMKNFKATAFQVEVEKRRKSKVTSKSRWAKKVKVAFELADVPEKYHGVRPIYMVIQDEAAKPIYVDNPIKASVAVNGQPTDILATEQKEMNIGEIQRINFIHNLDKRLSKGYYRVIIYTDIGILGASTFRLR